jgi:hypothetical protein
LRRAFKKKNRHGLLVEGARGGSGGNQIGRGRSCRALVRFDGVYMAIEEHDVRYSVLGALGDPLAAKQLTAHRGHLGFKCGGVEYPHSSLDNNLEPDNCSAAVGALPFPVF